MRVMVVFLLSFCLSFSSLSRRATGKAASDLCVACWWRSFDIPGGFWLRARLLGDGRLRVETQLAA